MVRRRGKSRTKGQRNGEIGEAKFIEVASDHGILASKPPDYGLDMLCQIEAARDSDGIARILGYIVAAVVRTTDSRRPRMKLDRADVEHMFTAKVPVLLVLVHLAKSGKQVYVRALDRELVSDLADFLASGRKTRSLSLSNFRPAEQLRKELLGCLKPGHAEELALHFAELRLAGELPDVVVKVLRGSQGAMSFVDTSDYLRAFALDRDEQRYRLFRSAALAPDTFVETLRAIGMKPSVLTAVSDLPMPVVFGGSLEIGEEGVVTLYAREPGGDVRACEFLRRVTADYTGFIHRSGFMLSVSGSTEHEGQHVHFIHAELGSGRLDLAAHPDLFGFLAQAVPGGSWSMEPDGLGVQAEYCGELPSYGIYAFELERLVAALGDEVPADLFTLEEEPSFETVKTISVAAAIATNPERGPLLGFAAQDFDSEEAQRMAIPLVANTDAAGYVIWLEVDGHLLKQGKYIVGLRIEKILRAHVEHRGERFEKASDDPELVARPSWRAIAIRPEGPQATDTDTSTWHDLGVRFPR